MRILNQLVMIMMVLSFVIACDAQIETNSSFDIFNKQSKKINVDNLNKFKKIYNNSSIIVKCKLIKNNKWIRYKIIKIYKNAGDINKISKKSVLNYKDDISLGKEIISEEAIFIFYSTKQNEYEREVFYIVRGTIRIGNIDIKPDLLAKPLEILKIINS